MFAKRALDLLLATVGLVVLALPFALIAAWVRIDSPGPALYRQVRVGRHGNPFRLLKFRTMVADADRRGPSVTTGGDERITRAGRFLRAWKLDELPQLVNVLRGEMSIVGPRPEVPEYVARYSDQDRAEVLSVRPGMTDAASIEFRREESLLAGRPDAVAYYLETIMPEKLRLYREYVRGRSFWLDLKLIARTALAVLGRG
jgi:lipopolysaccharide/colanic/teichoic acid biosynthesis glycosyltransferase